MFKPLLLSAALVTTLAGCPKKSVTIYRSLSEPGAMKTCDANSRFRVETEAADAKAAKSKAEAEVKGGVAKNKGCGAFVYNEASGKTLKGTTTHVVDYQLCKCE